MCGTSGGKSAERGHSTTVARSAAVRDAVRRRLAELGTAEGSQLDARRQRMLEIVRDFQADLTEERRRRIQQADDFLYDDLGLPR